MSDQLGMLFWIAIVPALSFLLLYFFAGQPAFQTWDAAKGACTTAGTCDRYWAPWVIVAVMMFGVLGAAFSIVYSIISTPKTAIPALSDKYITIIRSWCGAIAALAGHALIGSQILQVKVGTDGPSAWFALAFMFGYAGERPISRVVETVAGKPDAPNDHEPNPDKKKGKGKLPDAPNAPETPPQAALPSGSGEQSSS